MTIDPAVLAAIMGIAGIGVVGLTEMIKRFLKAVGVGAYIISAAVSAVATAFILTTSGAFAVIPFILYTLFVFLEANGIYKVAKKTA